MEPKRPSHLILSYNTGLKRVLIGRDRMKIRHAHREWWAGDCYAMIGGGGGWMGRGKGEGGRMKEQTENQAMGGNGKRGEWILHSLKITDTTVTTSPIFSKHRSSVLGERGLGC